MKYGRKEISEFLDGWIKRSGPHQDPFAVPTEKLFNLVCSNLGWYWDVENIGRAPHPGYGEEGSAIQGYYAFLEEEMHKRKQK